MKKMTKTWFIHFWLFLCENLRVKKQLRQKDCSPYIQLYLST